MPLAYPVNVRSGPLADRERQRTEGNIQLRTEMPGIETVPQGPPLGPIGAWGKYTAKQASAGHCC